MMLIATGLAAASTAIAADPGGHHHATNPPMIVNVTAAPDMAPDLVARILAERTDRIWRERRRRSCGGARGARRALRAPAETGPVCRTRCA